MNNEIEIMQATTLDDCKICNSFLEKLTNYEHMFDGYIRDNIKISNFFENTINKENSIIFIAKQDTEVIGFVMAYVSNNKSFKLPVVNIMNIYVDELSRKKNIGTKLMNKVEFWAKTKFKEYILELNCLHNNEQALKFYEKLGYKTVRLCMRKIV